MASSEAVRRSSILSLGDWQARVALDDLGKAYAQYVAPDGNSHERLPRTVKQAIPREQTEALQKRLKDIGAAQREARYRLEQTYRNDRDWAFGDWKERYQNHPLMRQMTARLIWELHHPERPLQLVLGTAPHLTLIDGQTIDVSGEGYRVRLWHPANTAAQVAKAWRQALLEREIRQPLWQAWRPVYSVTEPELQTEIYSNRFAGLLLTQPIFVRVLRNRGWVLKSRMWGDDRKRDPSLPARLALPGSELLAEFRGRGAGQVQSGHDYGAPNFEYFASSQIRFYLADQDSMQGAAPVRLSAVPSRAFCEAMFDIELATGLSAAGLDSQWHDPGPEVRLPLKNIELGDGQFSDDIGGLSSGELGKLRTELLGWLVPRLAISDRLRLTGHVLRVKGDWHEYDINTGNAAIRIVGLNRHLCIVPGGTSGIMSSLSLPFAGDEVLSVILSKAHLLANESAIKDETILAQIRRA